MVISLTAVLILLLISMEITPLISVLVIGGGNIVQLLFVFIIFISALMYRFQNIHIPKLPILIILALSMIELFGQTIVGKPAYAAVLLFVVSVGIITALSYGADLRKYSTIFYKFTDILVVLNTVALVLAVVSFDTFSHLPIFLSDESVFRKVGLDGELMMRSIGLVNFLQGTEVYFPIVDGYMPTGFSAEPHVFFSFIFIGLMFKLSNSDRSEADPAAQIIIYSCYVLSLLSTISFSNVIAISVSIVAIIFYSFRHKIIKQTIFIMAAIFIVGLFYVFFPYVLKIVSMESDSIVNIHGSENIYNRSGVQTLSSFVRLFIPSTEFGFLTVGPDYFNDFNVKNIFFVNLFLYWVLIFLLFIRPLWLVASNKVVSSKSEVMLLMYLFVYMFKNASGILYIPFVISSLVFLWYSFEKRIAYSKLNREAIHDLH